MDTSRLATSARSVRPRELKRRGRREEAAAFAFFERSGLCRGLRRGGDFGLWGGSIWFAFFDDAAFGVAGDAFGSVRVC